MKRPMHIHDDFNRTERREGSRPVSLPPGAPHRRYPSLSDDGQPYFPAMRWKRQLRERNADSPHSTSDGGRSPFVSVRFIALAALIVILLALALAA